MTATARRPTTAQFIGATFALWLALAAASALLPPSPAYAQATDARASREREALRRAQASLQEAQQQRDALQAEKAGLDKARTEAEAAAGQQRKALAVALANVKRLRDELTRLQAEQAADGSRHGDAIRAAESVAAGREQALQRQLAQALRESESRRQANAGLATLLATRSQALDDAARRNRELHALGLEALARYRDKGVVDQALQGDPVLGFTAVRIENVAEQLRQRLDALQLPVAAGPQ